MWVGGQALPSAIRPRDLICTALQVDQFHPVPDIDGDDFLMWLFEEGELEQAFVRGRVSTSTEAN